MKKATRRKKVFVGMSGGVDSSVSAALLKEQGYDVTGVFIKVWHPDFLPCQWIEDRRDAMRVCALLGIPFMTLDLEKEYKRDVVDYMVREYKAGRTPNPDVMCNKSVKFGAFLKKAQEMGADFVATGHYAQIVERKAYDREHATHNAHQNAPRSTSHASDYVLYQGADSQKDQSYFLWTLTQEQLSKIIFPVGGYTKPHVRKLAEKYNLPTASKKDSQGLCFVGKVDMKEFLMNFIPSKKGDVLSEKGEIIGVHDGVMYYTIGQRHGFTITKKTPADTPYYVISKDLVNNTVMVSQKDKKNIPIGSTKTITLRSLNWIGTAPESGERYTSRIRYRQTPQECTIKSISDAVCTVGFKEPQDAALGQSVVFYSNERCVGGGVIDQVL